MDKLGNELFEGDRVAFIAGSNKLETGIVTAVMSPSVRIDRDERTVWLPRLWRNGTEVVKIGAAA